MCAAECCRPEVRAWCGRLGGDGGSRLAMTRVLGRLALAGERLLSRLSSGAALDRVAAHRGAGLVERDGSATAALGQRGDQERPVEAVTAVAGGEPRG